MAELFKVLQPLEYYRQFLDNSIRPDGRKFKQFRPVALNINSFSTAEGSSLVKTGNTTVTCGVKAVLGAPKSDSPTCGTIVPSINFLMKSKASSNDRLHAITQLLLDIISDSKCILLEDLCHVEGKAVWNIFCDLLIMNDDGNIIDACVIAFVTALKNVLLPKVNVDEETNEIALDEVEKVALKLTTPISSTFFTFDDKIISDPTSEEENVSTAIITVVTIDDRICSVRKHGGDAISGDSISLCIKKAFTRAKTVKTLIDQTFSSK